MLTVGSGFTVTVTGAEVEVQAPSEVWTVNVPEAVTLMVCDVAPLDQRYDV
jgi:hypothetical protein